jgi:NADPH2:quinone reductase
MRAVLMTRPGGPEVLELSTVPTPSIEGDTQVLVRVRAAGLNPVDVKQRGRGPWYPGEIPFILGIDGAGIVAGVGKKVKDFREGDEVFFAHGGVGKEPGQYAEYAVMEERFLAKKPTTLSFAEAACVPSSLITAADALLHHGSLQRGEVVLIHAGGGGVGHLSVQLAAHHGARVCTTVNTEEKARLVTELGAEKPLFYERRDFVDEVLEWTGGRGVDLAIDLVGKNTFFRTFHALRYYGRIVTMLGPDPQHADWQEARLRNLRVCFELMPVPMFYDLIDQQVRQTEALRACVPLFEDGTMRVQVARTFPLEEVREAHRYIEIGDTMGKVALSIEGGE